MKIVTTNYMLESSIFPMQSGVTCSSVHGAALWLRSLSNDPSARLVNDLQVHTLHTSVLFLLGELTQPLYAESQMPAGLKEEVQEEVVVVVVLVVRAGKGPTHEAFPRP